MESFVKLLATGSCESYVAKIFNLDGAKFPDPPVIYHYSSNVKLFITTFILFFCYHRFSFPTLPPLI